MSDKKNIDRLFQEKFKDFEAAPPEFVWENIREALEEKKKKRVIPLWMRLSGVAAILIIGLFLGISYLSNTTPGNDTPVVLQNDAAPPNQPLKIRPTDNPIPNGGSITDSTNSVNNNDVNSAIVDSEASPSGNGNAVNNGDAVNNNRSTGNNKKGSKTSVSNRSINFNSKNNAVAHGGRDNNNDANGKVSTKPNRSGSNNTLYNRDNAVAGSEGSEVNRGNSAGSNPGNNNGTGGVNRTNSSNGALQNGKVNNPAGITNQGTAIADNNNGTTNNNSNPNDATPPIVIDPTVIDPTVIDKDLPVNEAIAEATLDTTAVVQENELEKLLQEKLNGTDEDKKEEVADVNDPKWKIKPQIAPVFYNSLSQGSPIDGQFASNSKSYDNDLSMGLGVNYAINKRLSIRSGINTVNLSYATQDIEFYATLNNSSGANNVTARSAAGAGTATIVVQNRGVNTPNAPQGTAAMPSAFSDVIPKETYNGAMVQSTGYVEVPVEVSYALLNKKFGIDVIGGVSTLFLNNNNINVVSTEGFSTRVGEAQNLNNIHFSTNVGVGFKYRFFKSFEANFEPTFKYQVNTFSRDAGNFKPYFIGLYSGISFSF